MSVDEFVMSTSQLDDGDLIRLAYIHGVLSNDTGLSDPVRGWHANLALGIAQVVFARRDALVALELDLASRAGLGIPEAQVDGEDSPSW